MSQPSSSSSSRPGTVGKDVRHTAKRPAETLSLDHSIMAANQLVNTGASQRQLLDAAGQLLSSHPNTPPGSSGKLLTAVHDLLVKSQDLKPPSTMSSATPVKHVPAKTPTEGDSKNNIEESKFRTPKTTRGPGSKPPERVVTPTVKSGQVNQIGGEKVPSTQQKSTPSNPSLTKNNSHRGPSTTEVAKSLNNELSKKHNPAPRKNKTAQHLKMSQSSSLCTYTSTWTNSSSIVCEPYVDTLANLQINIAPISGTLAFITQWVIAIPYSSPGGILAALNTSGIKVSTPGTSIATCYIAGQLSDASTSSYVITLVFVGGAMSSPVNIKIENLRIGFWSGPTSFNITEYVSTSSNTSIDMPVVVYPKGFFVGNMYLTRGMSPAQFPVTQVEYGTSVYVHWEIAQSGYRAYLSYNSSSCPVGDPYSTPIVPPGFDVSNLGTGIITYPNPITITKNTTFTLVANLPGVAGSNNLSSQIQNTISLTRSIDPRFIIATLVKQLVPVGTITAYNGTDPPTGWVLCDGNNGTPDLRGRFILGAQGTYASNIPLTTSSAGSTMTINDQGGEQMHLLSISELPSHNHGLGLEAQVQMGRNTSSGSIFGTFVGFYSDGDSSYLPRPGPGGTLYTGGQGNYAAPSPYEAHNNMPPFYVLTYIMKLSTNLPLVQLPLDGGLEDFSGSNTLAQYSPDNTDDTFKFVNDSTYGVVLQAAYPNDSLDPVVEVMTPLPATYTKSIWIKPSATFQTGGYQVFMGCMDPSGSNFYHYTCTSPNGGIRSGYRVPGHPECGIDTSSTPISPGGSWVHVVETYQTVNGSPAFNVYINGYLQNADVFGDNQPWSGSSSNYICLGNLGQVGEYAAFNGYYRYLEIYDCVFSPAQVLQLYNSQK